MYVYFSLGYACAYEQLLRAYFFQFVNATQCVLQCHFQTWWTCHITDQLHQKYRLKYHFNVAHLRHWSSLSSTDRPANKTGSFPHMKEAQKGIEWTQCLKDSAHLLLQHFYHSEGRLKDKKETAQPRPFRRSVRDRKHAVLQTASFINLPGVIYKTCLVWLLWLYFHFCVFFLQLSVSLLPLQWWCAPLFVLLYCRCF